MDIREVEIKTGLERPNIRYYEKEGLLSPVRRANGYRDYSDEDVRTLLKIRLLRRLKISVEQIRQLQEDTVSLQFIVDSRMQAIAAEQEDLQAQENICRTIQTEHATYSELDAARYLQMMDRPAEPHKKPSREIYTDKTIRTRDVAYDPPHPFRRYFAAFLDGHLYILICMFLIFVVFGVRYVDRPSPLFYLLGILFYLALYFLAESFILSQTGFTFGKWMLGERVIHDTGRFLTFQEAYQRNWRRLLYGRGLDLPIVRIWRLIKSYRQYENGENLEWDDHNEIEFLPRGRIWAAAAILSVLLIGLGRFCAAEYAKYPPNRWPLTVQQYQENVAYYKNPQYGSDMENVVVIDVVPVHSGYTESYEIENDTLQAVTMNWDLHDSAFYVLPPDGRYAILAYVLSQKASLWNGGYVSYAKVNAFINGLKANIPALIRDGKGQTQNVFGRVTVTLTWELTDPTGHADQLLFLKEKTGSAVITLSMKYE